MESMTKGVHTQILIEIRFNNIFFLTKNIMINESTMDP